MNTIIDEFRGKYYFLSNFSKAKVEYQGVVYPTSEHAFHAAKTKSKIERQRILEARSPHDAKRIGRTVTLRPRWVKVRKLYMMEVLEIKFDDEDLKERLTQTGDATLIEGNHHNDRFWGACRTDLYGELPVWAGRANGVTWHGENNLGLLLMELREK